MGSRFWIRNVLVCGLLDNRKHFCINAELHFGGTQSRGKLLLPDSSKNKQKNRSDRERDDIQLFLEYKTIITSLL